MNSWRHMLDDATKPLGWILCVFLFGMVAESYGGARLRAQTPPAEVQRLERLEERLERVETMVEVLAVEACLRIPTKEAARLRLPCARLDVPTKDKLP